MFLYSFESFVNEVFKTNLIFSCNTTKKGRYSQKSLIVPILEHSAFSVNFQKNFDVWMIITHKGLGLKREKSQFWKFQKISHLIGTEILHFFPLGADKIEFKVLLIHIKNWQKFQLFEIIVFLNLTYKLQTHFSCLLISQNAKFLCPSHRIVLTLPYFCI